MAPANSLKTQQGMLLIEGLIAILIFSFGILGIIGLQSATLRHSTEAKYRIDASFVANQTIGEMWTDRNNLASYEVTDAAVSILPNGKRTVEVAGTQVTVTVTWQSPGEPAAHKYIAITQING